MQVCWARLPRVARDLRALPRRRVGRRREATSTAPAAGCPPSGRHWPALARTGPPRQRYGTGGRQSRTAFPIQNVPIPQTTGIRPQSSAGQRSPRSRSTFPIKARAIQTAPPACRLPTPTEHIPMQRDASPTAHSRPNRPAASTSIGIEPAKQPTAPRLLHAPPSATGPGGRYINVGASHRGPPLLGSRARTVEGSEA